MGGGDSLAQVASEVRGCTRCRLATSRTHAVPGHGDPDAPLVLVGEAPGASEDATGVPFQGAAGRFLDRCVGELGVARDRLFITSVVKCRPPRNRVPRSDEVAACAGYLDRQLRLLEPRVVLAMGGSAAARLHPLGRTVATGELREQPVRLPGGARLLVTFHPAAALRFPARRQPFLDDLRQACQLAGLVG